MSENNLSSVEKIKQASDSLRGSITSGLADEVTGAISESDKALVKFHGMYLQDDRDRREERAEKKLERLYSFMIRLRLPGGFLTADQYLATQDIAGEHTTGVIKITTRQTVQLHGLLKTHIKPTIKAFSEAKLNSIATCGDINRNVICSAHPNQSPIHRQIHEFSYKINELLLPKTKAYYEIWLDEEKLLDKKEEEDPLYQDRYLPRKFKIAIAIPPNNDVDVFGNDLALIAIVEKNELKGFNVAIGGGMSSTHGNPATYPRLATVIGFVSGEEKILKTIYEIATIQRDYGNRSDRSLARLKYTVDRLGVDWFKEEIERRTGFPLEKEKPFTFTDRKDYYGWFKNSEGHWYYTPFIENGRVVDSEAVAMKTALYEIAKTRKLNFRFTTNQNVILSDITEKDKPLINQLLDKYRVREYTESISALRRNAMACVALNTCPLAFAEAQRYLPSLLDKIEPLLDKYGLGKEEIVIRMTGCPNGCARSYIAEIGFIGTSLGKYNLQLGGDHQGMRLNKVYRESLDEAGILAELEPLFKLFAAERLKNESFGDFAKRKQIV
ncbi:MAG TPA: NADPH-dependent assimilatory sulfite reductase hemoprotein subunit [Puia sp.]|nr:NADPH-dependent assimilatory sulfite reductase hemoprotein subunit [Puia sp.]